MKQVSNFIYLTVALLAFGCSPPTFSPPEGTYPEAIEVTLSSNPGETIYCSTDGSTPSQDSSDTYSGPISVDEDNSPVTIKAFTVSYGIFKSEVVSSTYIIDPSSLPVWYRDFDQDGYGDSENSTRSSIQPEGYISDFSDCDDGNIAIHPGAPEICGDLIDQDCDNIDEACPSTWYRDVDGDGFGDDNDSTQSVDQPAGYVANSGDCNDGDGGVFPGAEEACDGKDNNCNSQTDEGCIFPTWYRDYDNDGYGNAADSVESQTKPDGYVVDYTDCDDTNSDIHPDAEDIPDNNIDENCNGHDIKTWYSDADGDTWGGIYTVLADEQPVSYVDHNGDCNDSNANINPEASEIPDNTVDENCDGDVIYTYYLDADGDGYGNISQTTLAVSPPTDYVADNTDCDDGNSDVYPDAVEIPDNTVDENCDGILIYTWYRDADGDGFGNQTLTLLTETQPSGYVENNEDCDDSDPAINPDGTEIPGNGIDEDCDGFIPNTPPTADAGDDQTMTLCSIVSLDGSGSDDPDGDNANMAYIWTVGTPDGNSLKFYTQTASFYLEDAGGYNVTLIVNDGINDSVPDTAIISTSPAYVEQGFENGLDGWTATAGDGDLQHELCTSIKHTGGYSYEIGESDDWGCGGSDDWLNITRTFDPPIFVNSISAWVYKKSGSTCGDGYLIVNNGEVDEDGGNDLGPTSLNSWNLRNWTINGEVSTITFRYHSLTRYDHLYLDDIMIDTSCNPVPPSDWYRDADGDGYGDPNYVYQSPIQPTGYVADNTDCDDSNSGIHENCGALRTWYQDSDGDDFGNPAVLVVDVTQPAGYIGNSDDCDDSDPLINPDAEDIPNNGIDEDCSGGQAVTWYRDADGDGFGNPDNSTVADANDQPSGYISDNSDCDDIDPGIHPDADEIPDNGVDENCDGLVMSTYYRDADNDQYGNISDPTLATSPPGGYILDNTDCNDMNADVNPGTTEVEGNGIDDNCNGEIDEAFQQPTWYRDFDEDGYGDAGDTIQADTKPAGYVNNDSDCDDNDSGIFPGASEIPDNGIDEDCNGNDIKSWYRDADNDTFGNPYNTTLSDVLPTGYVSDNQDCDDGNADINPGANEIPDNAVDEDCNGGYASTWYRDADGDNYGASAGTVVADDQPDGFVAVNSDCDDGNAAVNPEAEEDTSNGIDDNCNGEIDEGGCDNACLAQEIMYAWVELQENAQQKARCEKNNCNDPSSAINWTVNGDIGGSFNWISEVKIFEGKVPTTLTWTNYNDTGLIANGQLAGSYNFSGTGHTWGTVTLTGTYEGTVEDHIDVVSKIKSGGTYIVTPAGGETITFQYCSYFNCN